jgi:hypothetical protein
MGHRFAVSDNATFREMTQTDREAHVTLKRLPAGAECFTIERLPVSYWLSQPRGEVQSDSVLNQEKGALS